MARERKPLIEPGTMLPDTDTLSRILERDRSRAGRRAPGEAEEPVTEPAPISDTEAGGNITSNITTHITAQQENNEDAQADAKQEEQEASSAAAREAAPEYAKARRHAATKAATQPETKSDAKLPAKQGGRADARQRAEETARTLAASRPIPITLRLPEALNDWLDDYAHAHRKQGIKKQDLISRAVQLLIIEASEETGEE